VSYRNNKTASTISLNAAAYDDRQMANEKKKSETKPPLWPEILRFSQAEQDQNIGARNDLCGYVSDVGLLLPPIPQQNGAWDMVSAKRNLPSSVTSATGHPAYCGIFITLDGMWRIGTMQDSQGNC
jgi:hypothetical protein